MKRLLLLIIALIEVSSIQAQPFKYWIQFTDKNGSPYSIGNPSVYLSARAISRRAKYGIPIKMNDLPPNPNYIDSVIAKGVKLLNRSGWFNAISIYAPDTTKLAAIRALPFVKGGSLVTIVGRKKGNNSNSNFKEMVGANARIAAVDSFNLGAAYNQEHLIHIDCLTNQGYRGKGKQIAVLDTRFGRTDTLTAFDSLRNKGQILATWDFVWEVQKVYDTLDQDVHGQEVLSTMAGILPGQYLGDAVDADFYLLRTEDNYSEHQIEDDNWASGAEYADSAGADIITSSLGYTTFDEVFDNYTYADMNGRFAVGSEAATIASEKGLVVCVAAGNNGGGPWQYVDSPGDADSILTVGAVDGFGNYASFSGTGPTSDHRIKPDVVAQGVSTALCSPGGGVSYGSGTSFATPTMAGAVACLWQAHPNQSNFQVMQAIKQSASQYLHPGDSLGWGIPNFCTADLILSNANLQKTTSTLSRVFPNPFNNSITVEFYSSIKQTITVSMYNAIGQTIYSQIETISANGNTLLNINGLDDLPQGLYLVTVKDESGKIYTGKVIK